jgi:hypothetical protein
MHTVDHATQIRCQSRRRLSRIAVGASCLHCMLGAQLLDLHPGRRKCPQHATKEPKAEGKNATDLLPPTGKLLLRLPTSDHMQLQGCELFLYEMAQQFNTCPWRAPNKLFLQEATRPFTRTCTRPAAHKSCCRMACDCLSGGECPPRPNAPLPHDICEMIRFVTESKVFYIG